MDPARAVRVQDVDDVWLHAAKLPSTMSLSKVYDNAWSGELLVKLRVSCALWYIQHFE